MQDVTIMAMASLAETRDNETGNHIRRTQHYVRVLALELRKQPKFAAVLDDATVELLFKSAPLHDIGKVGIPDAILLKPGKLTPEEFEVMKTHTTQGAAIMSEIPKMKEILPGLRSHHERWKGGGYPDGLSGEQIPLMARIIAVADTFDAMTTDRPYQRAMTLEAAHARINQLKGVALDERVVEAFNRAYLAGEIRSEAREAAVAVAG